jgi:hypothetical protein
MDLRIGWPTVRLSLIALTAVAGVAASCVPAAAQFWGDRFPNSRPYPQQQPPSRDFFSFPFDNGGVMRPPPVVDSTKAPPPRKLETPPTSTVVVIGDSMADWLAYGLDETYADQPDISVERKIRAYSGLVRYDSKNDTLEWPASIKDVLAAEKPNAIVVMLGLNDRVSLRDKTPAKPDPQKKSDAQAQPANQAAGQTPQEKPAAPADSEAAPQDIAASEAQRPAPGGSYDFHTDQWAAVYGKRVDEMIAALKTKGVPIIWVGLPAVRGTKSTSDVSYLDELYREHAEKAGITYVDIWDGFVDEQGRFAVQGPDFEGQTRRLRTGDGVHFTKAGAVKLASYVDRELRRALSSHVVPVALPGPESSPAKPSVSGLRPDVGPVVPLAAGGGEGGDLLGASGRPAQSMTDPIAAKVLSRGDPITAPAGRADDFSWPRSDANAAPDLTPEPVALTPAGPAKKGPPGKNDAKKSDAKADAKADAKNKPMPDAAPLKPHRSPSASLDGAPRPPAAVGRGF